MSLLDVSGICIQEETGFVLEDINFSLQEFQKIAIAGETGSGKSTLLKIIAGLIQPQAGEVLLDQQKVIGPQDKLVPGHPEIAYLSQQFELPQFLRVEQILRYANTLSDEDAKTLYEVCHINHLLKRRTDELSGGERQRIALARLLSTWPRLLLLDEPYSNLDTVHKNILKSIVRDIGEKLDITCMLISHDPLDTLSWADEIIVMKEGRILQKGTPKQIYKQPLNEYIAGLFGQYNLFDASEAGKLASLPGIELNGKKLLIRPESITIASDKNKAVSGVVKKITFYGSFYEIALILEEKNITVKTLECNFNEGDTVYVSLSPDDVWYL